jgi:hypothetical protein
MDAGRIIGITWFLAAGVALCLASAGPASADRGVAVDVGRIAISQKLLAGGAYHLPTIGVRNPGSEATSYRLQVSYTGGQPGKRPPADWFRFAPETLTLRPGESQPVTTRIVLPTGADPGEYEALIGAQIVTTKKGTQVGAGAAARLSFAIEPSSLLEAWWLKAKAFLSDHAPMSWILALGLLLSLLGWQLRRRFTLGIARRA